MELENEFVKQLRKLEFEKGGICLLALSGGMDSISLLSLCSSVIKSSWPFTLHAARVMHNIRDARMEERENHFCHAACAELGIPFEVLKVPIGAISHFERETGCGMEAAARRFRYMSLHKQAEKLSANTIFTAHTADDQLETIFMRVFTGSGPEGMVGIPRRNGMILRPLLGMPRENLRLYLKKKGRDWIEDETNALPIYTRNRVRNELFPLLKDIFPSWKSALLTLSERAQGSSEALDFIGRERLPMIIDGVARKWDAREWNQAPFYLRALALWRVFDDLRKGNRERLSWSVVKSILTAINHQKKWKGHGFYLKYSEKMIIIEALPVGEPDYWKGRLVFLREDLLNGTKFHIGSIYVRASLEKLDKSVEYAVYKWPFTVNFDVESGSFRVKENPSGQRLHDIRVESAYISMSYV